MVKFLVKLLGETRGNAAWDAIKGICQWGWPLLLAAFTGFGAWLNHAPRWQVYVVLGTVCIISYTVAFMLSRKPSFKNNQRVRSQFQADDQSQKLFATMVDSIKSPDQKDKAPRSRSFTTYDYMHALEGPESVGALIKFSNDIRSEQELEWLCDEFKKHGYKEPFELIWLHAGNFLKGHMLPVLKQARNRPEEINTEEQFVSFLATGWSDRNKWNKAQEKWLRARTRQLNSI